MGAPLCLEVASVFLLAFLGYHGIAFAHESPPGHSCPPSYSSSYIPFPEQNYGPPANPPGRSADEVYERFLRATRGNPVEALQRYAETKKWRRKEGMDRILKDPHPHFHVIKQNYPHYFHLRGLCNEPVYYETPAKINLNAIRSAGLTMDGLLRHYALVTEFMWTHVERSQHSKSIYVIDLAGIRLRDFAGEVIKFVKSAASFISQHYPERSGTIFVVNAPLWFNVIWKVVKPIIDPVTVEKVRVVRGEDNIRRELNEKIPIENIPPEYGGLSMPLGNSPEEHLLAELMRHNNDPCGI
uniref:CRAL-TRIO domain-containing protein n=1 Tax=Odontella aurita TaxID=265563 RepID=A0A7S4JHK7_9STRA|mmetsp:Transcript_46634/g.141291  ORF Transcript_46634/g.141291 Transcript_46634/m.141291 type:complete len:298 (+) Transcript_46634:173-1066(+)|eukprot:CAMPEP_0113572112 /NCGR_PEP_ID=MMETSP0015_2-20120614/25920_1 /TAXON_ID=2838 /ORGANISM="Odontella" /LENGTH=297 /DNA_ID=CAMNT_0000475121 /DNA_START=173 /DNA_END=1066 /DNA_ORIENTATION=- /assembly_acc=CAM_ASM_000160